MYNDISSVDIDVVGCVSEKTLLTRPTTIIKVVEQIVSDTD